MLLLFSLTSIFAGLHLDMVYDPMVTVL